MELYPQAMFMSVAWYILALSNRWDNLKYAFKTTAAFSASIAQQLFNWLNGNLSETEVANWKYLSRNDAKKRVIRTYDLL